MGFYYTPYWMALLGKRDLVHGPRQGSLGTPGQVSRNGMDRVSSFGEDIKPPCTAQARFV